LSKNYLGNNFRKCFVVHQLSFVVCVHIKMNFGLTYSEVWLNLHMVQHLPMISVSTNNWNAETNEITSLYNYI